MNNFNYSSIYGSYFKRFIARKKDLGYLSLKAEWFFLELDKLFLDNKVTSLGITKQQIDEWRATRLNDSQSTIYAKYSILSQFCKYLCTVGYDCYIPRMPVNPPKHNFVPYVFSHKEIANIFQSCDSLRMYDKHMSSIIFAIPAIIRLLYGTGMRISEALSLKNKDVDFNKRCIFIRKSKNGEERITPFSTTLEEVLRQYLHFRNQIPIPRINETDGFFFVSPNGTACRLDGVYAWFRKALNKSGIPHLGEHKGPRLHDFRHTFSVHSLVEMAKSGLDLYYSLPLLSTYLGHKSLEATEQYVRLTSEMYPDLLKDEKGICACIFPNPDILITNGNN
jgi:integrase